MAYTIEWTNAQWDAYEVTEVTIPVPLLDGLMLAVNMVAKGTRVEKGHREKWLALLEQAQEYSKQIEEKIDKVA